MNQVTTRRVIKPKSGVHPVEPHVRASAAGEALEPKARPATTLWTAWLERFAKVEQFSAGLVQEAERIKAKPQHADVPEARRLQETYLAPWDELVGTFEAAIDPSVSETLRADYRRYLELRTGLIRALIRRCLAPHDGSILQLDAAMHALQAFVDARRRTT